MAEHAPTVLTHPLLANLLVEAAVDTINVFRRSDSPDEVAHAASTTVETLAALFIDMGDALDHIVRLPDGWSHEAMAERVLPLLKEDPDLPEIPEDLGETERQAAIIVLTFNRIISGMIAAFAELSEQEHIDPISMISSRVTGAPASPSRRLPTTPNKNHHDRQHANNPRVPRHG